MNWIVTKYKGEWALYDKESKAYVLFGTKKQMEARAKELNSSDKKYAKGGGFSSFMSKAKSLGKTGLSKTKEAYSKTKEYAKGKVHDQKKKIALDVIYDAKENLPINREEIKALDKAFRVVEDKYAKGGGMKGIAKKLRKIKNDEADFYSIEEQGLPSGRQIVDISKLKRFKVTYIPKFDINSVMSFGQKVVIAETKEDAIRQIMSKNKSAKILEVKTILADGGVVSSWDYSIGGL